MHAFPRDGDVCTKNQHGFLVQTRDLAQSASTHLLTLFSFIRHCVEHLVSKATQYNFSTTNLESTLGLTSVVFPVIQTELVVNSDL